MRSSIIVRTQFEGFHKWVNAPKQVEFLKNLHRHMFNIEVKIEVDHNDRELEFFMVRHEIDQALKEFIQGPLSTDGTFSCEQVCEFLLEHLQYVYGFIRKYTVKVFEDSENGAEVTT